MEYCEICNKKTLLDKHHIKSRSKGGTDKDHNITYICSNCHKLVHYGLIIIEGRFDACSGNRVV
jgi:predicted HNH restriction endonuclease